ncbi:hypothetical protein AXF42_Ash000280 [Apostasia shenzhenica]|uniref:Uncharacterized protein n=1 Tax=Apostasia shenzhenica TaxID=1088818 RepID=A0A2I0AFY4_9ASPA|nr:hypothetical protein AXF42_Ash000280 [Apostasia shenzhenica]
MVVSVPRSYKAPKVNDYDGLSDPAEYVNDSRTPWQRVTPFQTRTNAVFSAIL